MNVVLHYRSTMLQTAPQFVNLSEMNIPTFLRGVMEVRGYRGVRHMTRELNKELANRGEAKRLDHTQVARWLHGETSPSVPSCRLLHTATEYPFRDIVLMAAIGDGVDGQSPSRSA